MKNLVVAKYTDGRLVKGFTTDFTPKEDVFHVAEEDNPSHIHTISTSDLKAVFFVKSTTGNKEYVESKDFDDRRMYGRKVEVEFSDGETIRGYTQIYHPKASGFFMFPADPKSNNDRIYVVKSATRRITFI